MQIKIISWFVTKQIVKVQLQYVCVVTGTIIHSNNLCEKFFIILQNITKI